MMLTLKNLFLAVVAICALLAAIGDLKPSSAQMARPVQDVSVVNAPTVQAQQAGPWTVSAQLAPGSTVGISGTPTVSISGTPTVNVGSLPASGLDVRPVFPAHPRSYDVLLSNADFSEVIAGNPGALAFGLTSVTFTNFDPTPAQMSVQRVTTSMANCTGAVTGGSVPSAYFLVQGRSTLHVTYPTPLPFYRIGDVACIEVQLGTVLAGGSVDVILNGFAQH
jgi:hypothetical protein